MLFSWSEEQLKTENKEINSLLSSLLFSWRTRKTASLQSVAWFSLECWRNWFYITSPRDWLEDVAPPFHPIRSNKTKSNRDLLDICQKSKRMDTWRFFPTIYYVFCLLCCLAFAYKERQNGDGKTLNFEFGLFLDCILVINWNRKTLDNSLKSGIRSFK